MKINAYLDATYLKTAEQVNLSENKNKQKVINLLQEAITYNYKLVMIRANYITLAKNTFKKAKANTLIGTVIGFPTGTSSIKEKIKEAQKAIKLDADELDFVINYNAFKKGDVTLVEQEIIACTKLCLNHNKVIKWIIETAALTSQEIIVISQLIKKTVIHNFTINCVSNVFVKSSTGFYKTKNNLPNGATFKTIKLIVKNAKPLKIKAAGGVKDYKTAIKMIHLGVDRIGTSSSKEIVTQTQTINTTNY